MKGRERRRREKVGMSDLRGRGKTGGEKRRKL